MTSGPAAGEGFLDAFGLGLTVEFPLPGTQANPVSAGPFQARVKRTSYEILAALLNQPRLLKHLQTYEGQPYAALASPQGDVLFQYGWGTLFHLSTDHRLLRCAFHDPDDRRWQRVLLDTVLWSVSLEVGFELLHASAVHTPGGVIAFVAPSGGGKSSLAAEFIRRGATLFSDDIVALTQCGDGLVAHPGPPVINLPRALEPQTIGAHSVLAEFGDERWVQVDVERPVASTLRAVVLLNRAPRRPTQCSKVDATCLALLPHAIALPHMNGRERHRFEIFSTLAATTAVFGLDADLTVSTSELADRVDDWI